MRATSILPSMPRLDHAAFASPDPDAAAAFYERVFGARVVRTEGHPVMAYVGNTGFAFHGQGGPDEHIGVRVDEDERERIKQRLDEAGIEWRERGHGSGTRRFLLDTDR